jgi:hypothetical protein
MGVHMRGMVSVLGLGYDSLEVVIISPRGVGILLTINLSKTIIAYANHSVNTVKSSKE